MSKIAAIETFRCSWYPRPLWVHITTDDGITGLGETTGGPGAVESVIHDELAPLLLGREALDIEGLHSSLTTAMRIWRTRDAAWRALSALDIALWDIAGQHAGQPIWRMLGGKSRDAIPVYNTCASAAYAVRQGESAAGLSRPASSRAAAAKPAQPDDLQWFLSDPGALANSLLADGFRGMKVWPFDQFAAGVDSHYISGEQVRKGKAVFEAITQATGGKMAVAAELHSVWSLPAALRIVDALNDFDLMWVEDPVGAHDTEALAQVARASRNPIAASESLASRESYLRLFDQGRVGVCMLDVSWVGGLTEARAVAAMARAAKVPVTPHDCTGPVNLMAGLHLSIHAPNAIVQETVRAFNREVYRRVVDRLPEIREGFALAPTAPGLGMKLRAEFVRSQAVACRKSEA